RNSARHCSRSRRRYCCRNTLWLRSPGKTPGRVPPEWRCRARSAGNICHRSCARKTRVRSRRRAARAPAVAAARSARTDRRRNWTAAPAVSARRRKRNRTGLRRKPGRAQEPARSPSLRQASRGTARVCSPAVYATPTPPKAPKRPTLQSGFTIGGDGKRAVTRREVKAEEMPMRALDLSSPWPGLTWPSTLSPRFPKNRRGCPVKPGHNGEGGGRTARLILQEFTRLVQRAKLDSRLRKGLVGAFLAVDHGEDLRDV